MKIVINKQYGGFGISALAVKRLAELDGKKCYFFKSEIGSETFEEITLEETEKHFCWHAFSVKNPDDFLPKERRDPDGLYKSYNAAWGKIELTNSPKDRANPNLIRVVKELGKKANGPHASLKIVTIPDGIDWEIDEYDGMETVEEKHRSWG